MSKVAARLDRGLGRLGRFEWLYKVGTDMELMPCVSTQEWKVEL